MKTYKQTSERVQTYPLDTNLALSFEKNQYLNFHIIAKIKQPPDCVDGPEVGDGRTYGRTDGRMENLPILQDFVPYRGRCPVTAQI